MTKVTRVRKARFCEACQSSQKELFRIKTSDCSEWRFVCKTCQSLAKLTGPDYQYGGTWKQCKRN